MTTERSLLGAVLAGGKSRRFGSDKATELLDGEALASRAARILATVFDDVVVVSSAPAPADDRWRRIADLRPDHGPLGGLEAALDLARTEGRPGVFLLACDLPLMTPEAVRSVLAGLGTADAAAAAREGAPGHEPLCAAYRSSCLGPVRALLDRGELAIHEVANHVALVRVEVGAEEVLNVNTPADREVAENLLRARGG